MSRTVLVQSPSTYETSGGRLVCADGRTLPLTQASLTANAKAGVAQVTLKQTFHNPHAEPLRVTYSLPLPADGAVSGFSFTIGDQRIIGEVDTRQQARQRFEDAVLEGRTAAILDQERTSLFTQEVGNVPPRLSVVCEIVIDQKLLWLADGFWEWRFPTVVAPRYLGQPGRVADHDKVSVEVADQTLPTKLSLELTIRDTLADGFRPESPSHPLHTVRGVSEYEVTFAAETGASLDRDVVVRWKAAAMKVGVELDVASPSKGNVASNAYGLLTLVPPVAEAKMTALPRDLIVLLDTSGSMGGEPLEQARRFTHALIDSLDDGDTLELIEFSSFARRWKPQSVKATASNRKDAQRWLSKLVASGGTEMASGIIEALAPLRKEAQRQVVLITDGLIGSEHEVLSAIAARLPSGSRVHTIGVGSGVNRSLTQPAARAGRGVELVMGLGEDVEVALRRLLSRTVAPLITDLELSGTAVVMSAPQRLPDVYSGSPALMSMKLNPQGGTLTVRGRTAIGDFEETLNIPAPHAGAGSRSVSTLFARECVEDLEMLRAVEPGRSLDAAIQSLGLDFQISTRLTSWVAVSEQMTIDPRLPRRTVIQPQELAHGLSAEGVGLRQAHMPPIGAVRRSRTMAGVRPMMLSKMGPPRGKESSEPEASIPPPSVVLEEAPMSSTDEEPIAGAFYAGAGAREEDGAEAPAPIAAEESSRAPALASPPKQEKSKFGLSELLEKIKQVVMPSSGKELTGRILRQHGDRLDIEIALANEIDWMPAKDVVVKLANGTQLTVAINVAFTTMNGRYGAGLKLMLTLTTPGEIDRPVEVELSNHGQNITVVLEQE